MPMTYSHTGQSPLHEAAPMAASNVPAEPIPDDLRVVHVLNRLSLGPAPTDVDRVRRIGVQRYIHEQLNPDSIPETDGLVREIAGLDTLSMSPIALYIKYQVPINQARKSFAQERSMSADAAAELQADPGVRAAQNRRKVVAQQAMAARMMRSLEGPRQLQEVMADFWFNHFNVFAGKGPGLIWVGAYEQQAIRPNTLGRFRDLLGATAKHPAMLFYLDNWQNTAPGSPGARVKEEGINENYARELMELHTLGVNGGYTQADVIALARILTGWGLPRRGMNGQRGPRRRRVGRLRSFEYPQGPAPWTGDGFLFDSSRHDFGDKSFLGHTIRGSGIDEGEQALDILAHHPATARHISFKLAQYFVADEPPASIVEKLGSRFHETDGDLRAVLASLFESDEFWQKRYFAAKFKTPYHYVLSAVRAAGVRVRNFKPLLGAIARLGMPLYQCQTPDGYKNTQDAWLNPDAMMQRLDFATALGAGRLRLAAPPANDGYGMGMGEAKGASLQFTPEPIDAGIIATTLGGHFSEQTASAMEAAPEQLRGAVILGSPEFMRK